MRFFTRYFQDSKCPYHLLDFFEIYDEAEKYDNEFYISLLEKRKRKLLTEENSLSIECIDQYIHSIQYTASAWSLLSRLPVDIVIKIADTRVYFLYAITHEVFELISNERDAQDKKIKRVIEDYEYRKKKDLEKSPKHWKILFEIDWMQALLEAIDINGCDMNIKICTEDREKYDINLRDVKVLTNETNITYGVIYYAETLVQDNKIELNLLTNFNEMSIIAVDVDVKFVKCYTKVVTDVTNDYNQKKRRFSLCHKNKIMNLNFERKLFVFI